MGLGGFQNNGDFWRSHTGKWRDFCRRVVFFSRTWAQGFLDVELPQFRSGTVSVTNHPASVAQSESTFGPFGFLFVGSHVGVMATQQVITIHFQVSSIRKRATGSTGASRFGHPTGFGWLLEAKAKGTRFCLLPQNEFPPFFWGGRLFWGFPLFSTHQATKNRSCFAGVRFFQPSSGEDC